eukprot:TRINITY_DN6377_c0_g1_i2.p1 TRINITY_DN6377_c0_g1~~TRINITY_DN6377_c0_g1_i2.p1  ORF type:complete len:298 (+),score=72.65 TRINITY_DN6377_c0_g1_i2:3-896(+)
MLSLGLDYAALAQPLPPAVPGPTFFEVLSTGDPLALNEYIDNFAFIVNKTWLASWTASLGTCAFYVVSLVLLELYLRQTKKKFDLRWFVIIHNFLLSVGSLILLVAMVTELYAQMSNGMSLIESLCDSTGKLARGRLAFYHYINMTFKYWELVDTYLLSLRRKDLTFLHCYHHPATLVLTMLMLHEESALQWVIIVLNLIVHVFMYGYYCMMALKLNCWWKKYITTMQIVQFVVGVSTCVFAVRLRVLHGMCYGTFTGAYLGTCVLSTYLFLFIRFFFKTYSPYVLRTPRGKEGKDE